jgi:hypothetical protein
MDKAVPNGASSALTAKARPELYVERSCLCGSWRAVLVAERVSRGPRHAHP